MQDTLRSDSTAAAALDVIIYKPGNSRDALLTSSLSSCFMDSEFGLLLGIHDVENLDYPTSTKLKVGSHYVWRHCRRAGRGT